MNRLFKKINLFLMISFLLISWILYPVHRVSAEQNMNNRNFITSKQNDKDFEENKLQQNIKELMSISKFTVQGIESAASISNKLLFSNPYKVLADMGSGDSYVFTNNDTAARTIYESNSGLFDYVVYNKDGSQNSLKIQNKTSGLSVSIPAEGSIVITVNDVFDSSGVLEISEDGDYFTLKSTSVPAFYKINMNLGESYEFDNNDTKDHTILNTSGWNGNVLGIIEYVIYDKNGIKVDQQIKASKASISIPAGGKLIVTVASLNSGVDTIEFDIAGTDDQLLTRKTSSIPAFYKTNMQPGNSYEVDNNDIQNRTIVTSSYWRGDIDGTIEYVVYDKNGTKVDQQIKANKDVISVPAGGKLIVTVVSVNPGVNGIDIDIAGIENKLVTGKVSSIPAFNKTNIKLGESYEVDNNDIQNHTVITSSYWRGSVDGTIEYVIYDKNGTKVDQQIRANKDVITIPAGGKLIVTVVSVNSEVSGVDIDIAGIENKLVTGKVSAIPAFNKINIKLGDSYEVDNNDVQNHTVITSSYWRGSVDGTIDYIVYDESGAKIEQKIKDSEDVITIPAGGKLVVTVVSVNSGVSGINIDIAGIENKLVTGKVSSIPAFNKTNINLGDSYEVDNNDIQNHTIVTSSYYRGHIDGTIDYVVYDKSGTKIEQQVKNSEDVITIPAGGKLIVTVVSVNSGVSGIDIDIAGMENKLVIGKVSSIPAFYKNYMQLGDSYEFDNNDVKENTIITTSGWNYNGLGTIEYVIYDKSGMKVDQQIQANKSTITIPAGGKLIVTVASLKTGVYSIEFDVAGLDNNFITRKVSSIPAFYKTYIQQGDSYEFDNNDTKDHSIVSTSGWNYNNLGIIEYVIYDKNGMEIDQQIQANKSTITIPAGCKLIVTTFELKTGIYSLEFDVSGMEDKLITRKLSSSPAFRKVNLNLGDSYEFVNSSSSTQSLLTTSNFNYSYKGNIDYTVYNADGSKYSSVTNVYTNSIAVPAGGKVDVTVTKLVSGVYSLNFAGAYNYFDFIGDLYIVSSSPTSITKYIPTVTDININFSRNIEQSANFDKITLSDANGDIVKISKTIDGSILAIKHDQLNLGTQYKLTVPMGAVKPLDNDNSPKDYNLIFKTGEVSQDVNGDGKIDILDIAKISNNYNSNSKSTNWNKELDINNDGRVDLYDLVLTSRYID